MGSQFQGIYYPFDIINAKVYKDICMFMRNEKMRVKWVANKIIIKIVNKINNYV